MQVVVQGRVSSDAPVVPADLDDLATLSDVESILLDRPSDSADL